MKIDHIALWADDIDLLKSFYVRYFNAIAGNMYHNPTKNLTSYFLTFSDGETKLEIMNAPDIIDNGHSGKTKGFCHITISVGSRKNVDELTEKLSADGAVVIAEQRVTGDGYYESIIADPEGNWIEITI